MAKTAAFYSADRLALSGIGKFIPKALRGIGYVGKGAYKAVSAVGGPITNSIQWAGDKLVSNPGKAIASGIPVAYLLYTGGDRLYKSMDNINPHMPYRR